MAILLLQEIVVTNMIGLVLRLYPAFGQCGSGMITRCLSGFVYKDFGEYMDTWIKVNFLMSNCTPDAEFMKDFFEAYTKMNERLISRRKQISEEEDKAILEQEKAAYELKEQAK